MAGAFPIRLTLTPCRAGQRRGAGRVFSRGLFVLDVHDVLRSPWLPVDYMLSPLDLDSTKSWKNIGVDGFPKAGYIDT